MATTKAVSFIDIPFHEIRWFDANKRVAVSRLGYIALIRHQNLVVVNLKL